MLLTVSVRWRYEPLQHAVLDRPDQPGVADRARFKDPRPGAVHLPRAATTRLRARVSPS